MPSCSRAPHRKIWPSATFVRAQVTKHTAVNNHEIAIMLQRHAGLHRPLISSIRHNQRHIPLLFGNTRWDLRAQLDARHKLREFSFSRLRFATHLNPSTFAPNYPSIARRVQVQPNRC